MNNQTITLAILLVGIMAMIFPAHTAANGQIFLTNEQQQLQNQPQQLNPNFMSFEQFMQYMFYYEKMFGKDYVTKIYKEYHDHDDNDDDDDDDKKKDNKKRDKDWWKHNSVDLWKDKKKYCEGKGEFKNGKCITDNEEDETAWEDAVCDNNPGNKKFCGSNKDNKKKEDNDDKDVDSIKEANEKLNDLFSNDDDENDNNNDSDVKDQDEEEEQEQDDEPEEEDEEDDDDDDEGEEE